VKLFRPWSNSHFLNSLPESVKKVAVLDKVLEEGALGNPLYLDVVAGLSQSNRKVDVITGGTYGLSSKEFTPAMIKAVYDNLNNNQPKIKYNIGINDDVTNTHLEYGESFKVIPNTIRQFLFWGLGGDGTIGANKAAIKTLTKVAKLNGQGHFVNDSKKTDGCTISHLRIGPDDINASYGIESHADQV